MASIAKLIVTLGAHTRGFETDMQRASRISGRELKKMEYQAKQLSRKWNRHFKLAGLAVAGGLVLATRSAIKFEKAMAEVSTLLDDTSGLKKTSDAVKQLSIQFGQSPVDTAKALYQIISAGASGAAEQMELLTIANKLAVGGVTDVATAADGLTTVLNAYAGQGLNATQVSDILFATMRGGKTTIGELSQTIGLVATMAGQTGVTFEELGAAIATITKAGIKSSEAMSGLRGVLTAVLKQTDQSVKMAKTLGVEFGATALKTKGLHKFLADIAATGATTEQLAKLFGRVEGLTAVMALGSNEADEFNRQLKLMENAAGATETAVGKMLDTTAQKAASARVAIEVMGIAFGDKFLASVAGASDVIVKNIDKITSVIVALVTLLTIRLGIMGVAAIAGMTSAMGGLRAAMVVLGGPIGAVALGLGSLYIAWKQIKEIMARANEDIKLSTDLLIKQARAFREVGDAAALAILKPKLTQKITDLTDVIGEIEAELKRANMEYLKWADLSGENSQKTKQLKDEVESLGFQLFNARKNLRAYKKELVTVGKETSKTEQETEDLAGGIEKLGKRLTETEVFLGKFSNEADVSSGAIADLEIWVDQLTAQMDPLGAAIITTKNAIIDLDDAFERGIIPTMEEYDRLLTFILDREHDRSKALGETVSGMSQFAIQAARAMQTAFANFLFDPFDKGLRGMLRSFAKMLRQMIAQAVAAQILSSLFGGLAGSSSGFLSSLGKAFGGTKDHGGRGYPGNVYAITPKAGTELFVPDSAGTFIPNVERLGGAVNNITVNIDARETDDPARLLALVPVIQAGIEEGIALKLRRGYL